jgi:hypothetical protein
MSRRPVVRAEDSREEQDRFGSIPSIPSTDDDDFVARGRPGSSAESSWSHLLTKGVPRLPPD